MISILGRVYMPKVCCPFRSIDKVLEDLKKRNIRVIIIDIHAEATSEKIAFGFYTDGRVSAVAGTHTHIQTNDLRILPDGTGYITDLGMCGDRESVIGVDRNIILERFLDQMPKRFKVTCEAPMLNGALFTIDRGSGKCVGVKSLNIDF